MLAQENKALVSRIYEAFNTRNIAALDDLLAPGFIDRTTGLGAESIKEAWFHLFSAYPHICILPQDMLAERDQVAVRVQFQGVATPPEQDRAWMVEIARIVDGKVIELWTMISWK